MAINAGLVIPRASAASFVEQIQHAESLGISQVWTTVGGTNADYVTAYAAAAVQTSSVRFGTSIVPTYPRHPITLASQVIALESLAPSRLRLGIGPSHRPTIETMFGIPMGKPLDHLREYLTILRSLLWDGSVDFAGEYLEAHIALPADTEPPKTPLPISALRSNAFRLAGELADGALSWVSPVPYLAKVALPALQEGADLAQRERPPLIAHVPVAVSEDRDASRTAFRKQFPVYSKLPFYQNMFADAGFPVTADEQMSDELVDELVVSGSQDEIAKRLEAIHAEGIDEVYISQVPISDADQELQLLAEVIRGS